LYSIYCLHLLTPLPILVYIFTYCLRWSCSELFKVISFLYKSTQLQVNCQYMHLMISKEPELYIRINYTFNFFFVIFCTFFHYLISTNYPVLRADVCEEWGDPELRTAHTAGRYSAYSYYPPADLSFSSFVKLLIFINVHAAWKFGIEAWVLKKREEQRLETAQMKFLRHLLVITKLDKEKIQCIRQKTGAQNTVKEIKQYQKSGYNMYRGWTQTTKTSTTI